MDRKERWELTWTIVSIVLLAAAFIGTLPHVFTVGGNSSVLNNLPDPAPANSVVLTNITAIQYVFMVHESGPVNSKLILPNGQTLDYYYNLMVVPYGGWLNATMYAEKATANLYIPTYNAKYVVNTQIVPGLVQYAVWGAVDSNNNPIPPGVYTFLSGEYTGPWYSYHVGEIIVLPQNGHYYTASEISQYEQMMQSVQSGYTLDGDPYNPPVVDLTGTMTPHLYLVADNYDTFNSSVPGPTAVVKAGSQVTVTMYIPTPDNDHNYLLNYTSTGKPQIVDNVYVGIYALYPNGTIVPVEYKQIQYNTPMTFTFSATGAPVYLYGIVYPVFNVYNVAGMSGMLTGEDKGMVMSLWGAILVEG